MNIDASRLLHAIRYMSRKHKGQTRKASQAEYATHPLAVSYILASYKRSKKLIDLLIAAVLHDVVEDTDATYVELTKQYGPLVASLVQELTNDKEAIAKMGKKAYQLQKLLGISSYALYIKLADRMHNISDNPTQKMLEDTLEIMLSLKDKRRLSKAQTQMVDDIIAMCHDKLKS